MAKAAVKVSRLISGTTLADPEVHRELARQREEFLGRLEGL